MLILSLKRSYLFLPAIGLLVLGTVLAPAARATIIIDQLNTSQVAALTLPSSLPAFAGPTGVAAGTAIGGSRMMALYAAEGEEDDLFRLRVGTANGGTVRFATDPSIRGNGLITYNGTTAPNSGVTGGMFHAPSFFGLGAGSGGNALDLTEDGNNAQIKLRGYADNNGLPVIFTIWQTPTRYARGTIFIPGSATAAFSIHTAKFANFSGSGLAPGETVLDLFEDVRAITVELNGAAGGVAPGTDAVIDYYLATSIPEPAASVLIGSALLALGLLGRRHRNSGSVVTPAAS